MNRRIALIASVVLLVAGGCARLDYVKVPTPTQYSGWTDEDQRHADKMKGVRYYLPRPFLQLKQSTPVAQRVALISFRRDGDRYLLELPEDAPAWVRRAAPKHISVTQAMAAMLAGGTATVPRAGEKLQSALGGGDTNAPSGAAGTEATAPATTNRPPSELKAQTGFINQTDPVTRLGDRMDVVYLPDFEEQFVIQPHAGLGTADIETRLRNGWAAEVFSQKVDNSNLIPYAINQFERASDAAANITMTWAPAFAGLPPGTSPAKLLKLQSEKAGEGQKAARDFLGEVLLFKLAEVKVAQPGLYPILKPREIRQWFRSYVTVAGPDFEKTFETFLQQANVPWIRPDMAFIPCPPMTVIAFNATTDLFIAPATDRVTDASAVSETKVTQPEQQSAVAKVVATLVAAKGSLDQGLAVKIDWDHVTGASAPNATSIQVNFNVAQDQVQTAPTALKDWAQEVLKVQNVQATVSPSLDQKTAVGNIQIPTAASEIVKNLP